MFVYLLLKYTFKYIFKMNLNKIVHQNGIEPFLINTQNNFKNLKQAIQHIKTNQIYSKIKNK